MASREEEPIQRLSEALDEGPSRFSASSRLCCCCCCCVAYIACLCTMILAVVTSAFHVASLATLFYRSRAYRLACAHAGYPRLMEASAAFELLCTVFLTLVACGTHFKSVTLLAAGMTAAVGANLVVQSIHVMGIRAVSRAMAEKPDGISRPADDYDENLPVILSLLVAKLVLGTVFYVGLIWAAINLAYHLKTPNKRSSQAIEEQG